MLDNKEILKELKEIKEFMNRCKEEGLCPPVQPKLNYPPYPIYPSYPDYPYYPYYPPVRWWNTNYWSTTTGTSR